MKASTKQLPIFSDSPSEARLQQSSKFSVKFQLNVIMAMIITSNDDEEIVNPIIIIEHSNSGQVWKSPQPSSNSILGDKPVWNHTLNIEIPGYDSRKT
jgi:hypothetical protein